MMLVAANIAVNVGCACVGFLFGLNVMYWMLKTGLDKELEEKLGGDDDWD